MTRRLFTLLLALVLTLLVTTIALAQSGGTYNLEWNTFDGGGVTFSTGGAYSVGGTAGQPDAGSMSGGSYALSGGFWLANTSPTAAYLVSFSARVNENNVRLKWVTNSERETNGYQVWRSADGANGAYNPVNADLIAPIHPGVDLEAAHTFTDTVSAGEYFYRVEIVKSIEANEWSDPLRVQVGDVCVSKPTKPKLATPRDGAAVNQKNVTLKWNAVTCADAYQVILRRDSRQGKIVERVSDLTDTAYTTKKLRAGVTYFWQVRACNANGCKKSAWHSFSIKP
jgi:hypothetical protein